MRKLLAALALLLGVLFLLTRFTELQDILGVLRRGNLVFLFLALLVQLAWIHNLSAFYQSVYRVFGMEEKRLHLLKLVTAANFLTVVAPSGGLSGIAIFLSDARRQGQSVARVTVACVLYVWFEYISTLVFLTLGLAEMAYRRNLHGAEIAASLVLLAGALGMGLLLYQGMQSAAALGATLAWMARAVNALVRPFTHRDYLQVERAYTFSNEMAEGLSVLRQHPRWAVQPLFLSLLNKTMLLVVLLLCFLAFKLPLDLGALVAGFSIAKLFLIVSPTPAGLGIVEGVLAVALTSLGVPLGDAAVVTVAYRGFSFWLPFFVGMVTIRMLSRMPEVKLAEQSGKTAPSLGPGEP